MYLNSLSHPLAYLALGCFNLFILQVVAIDIFKTDLHIAFTSHNTFTDGAWRNRIVFFLFNGNRIIIFNHHYSTDFINTSPPKNINGGPNLGTMFLFLFLCGKDCTMYLVYVSWVQFYNLPPPPPPPPLKKKKPPTYILCNWIFGLC